MNRNTTFDVPGLAGLTRADQVGMIGLVIFIFCVAMILIALGTSSKRSRRTDGGGGGWNTEELRSPNRTYNRTNMAPISDAGFGARRIVQPVQPVQDPNGYWRTAQPYEAPIGVARVRHIVPPPRRQLAIAARPVSPATGYRVNPRQSSLLGLQDDVAPISPPMHATYAPVSRIEVESIAPTSPALPSARHYAPSYAHDAYAPGYSPTDQPTTPSFNAFTYAPITETKVSSGRHAEHIAWGSSAQRANARANRAALSSNTMQIPIIDMRELLLVG